MKFFKVEWTKKKGTIALLATALAVSSFVLGGYVATGNLNPWGNRHYYQVLNANFQACYTPAGSSTPQCQTAHNTLFNVGAQYVEKSTLDGSTGFCAVSATCSFQFIAMSDNATAWRHNPDNVDHRLDLELDAQSTEEDKTQHSDVSSLRATPILRITLFQPLQLCSLWSFNSLAAAMPHRLQEPSHLLQHAYSLPVALALETKGL